ncbi:hypothetical protein B005_0193 [Nocardiopsis alba ATCC BAA-2165]|uniref:Uncharacterized protein n=1 Tax=Nocardiopsis alba (strain ATCC BAA-2165 / BE74) TaxID=1205910 RepID=J7L8D2_NOCAA|nr:hypothetical protein B005_0193 [Nocardiopsis alba ATCC BAA-2165]
MVGHDAGKTLGDPAQLNGGGSVRPAARWRAAHQTPLWELAAGRGGP